MAGATRGFGLRGGCVLRVWTRRKPPRWQTRGCGIEARHPGCGRRLAQTATRAAPRLRPVQLRLEGGAEDGSAPRVVHHALLACERRRGAQLHATRFVEAARRPAPKGPAHSFCLLCPKPTRGKPSRLEHGGSHSLSVAGRGPYSVDWSGIPLWFTRTSYQPGP